MTAVPDPADQDLPRYRVRRRRPPDPAAEPGAGQRDGADYYAVFADGGMDAAAGDGWLREHVLPHLRVTLAPVGGWAWDAAHADHRHVRPRARSAGEVRAFIGAQPEPEIWACYSPYDAVVLRQLWGPMNALPVEIPMFTRDLMQEADRTGIPLPAQDPPVRHALHDRRIAHVIGLIR